MDSVFKKYNVYEDVADIIAKEVNKGFENVNFYNVNIQIG